MDEENDYIDDESLEENEDLLDEDLEEEYVSDEGGNNFSYGPNYQNQPLIDRLKELRESRQNVSTNQNGNLPKNNLEDKQGDLKSKGDSLDKKGKDELKDKSGMAKDGLQDKASEGAKDAVSKGAEKAGEKVSEEASKKVAEKATEKAAEEASKKVVEGAAAKAASSGGLAALKLKIIFWAAVVILAIIVFIGLVSYFIFAFRNLFGSLSTFFGVPEVTSGDNYDPTVYEEDGLMTNKKYQYIKSTCDIDNYNELQCSCSPEEEDCRALSHEELVKVLKNDDKCKIDSDWLNFWDNVGRNLFGVNKFNDTCQLLRYVRGNIDKYEKKYSNYDLKLDKGLVVSTILSTYDNQSRGSNDKITESINHYEVLKNIINEKIIDVTDVDNIIKNTIYADVYPYYTYEDGNCVLYQHKNYKFGLDKWKLYMRYGYDNSYLNVSSNSFSVPGILKVGGSDILDLDISDNDLLSLSGSGWMYENALRNAWRQSSEECRGESFFTERGINSEVDLSLYNQKMENLDSPQKEILLSGSLRDGNGKINVDFDYRAGFVYNKFTAYKKAVDSSEISYDDALMPKQIEQMIEGMIDRKSQINSALFFEDEKSYYFTGAGLPNETNAYYWPIGSDEIKQINGIEFAFDAPSSINITSNYGPRIHPKTGVESKHNGIDISGKEGVTNVIASKSGKVVKINNGCIPGNDSCGSGYGNYIKISHEDGNYTLYAHLHNNSIRVKENDEVSQGQVIAKVGNSGRSTGPHLHFEVRTDASTRTDPLNYVDPKNPRPENEHSIALTDGENNKNTVCLSLLQSGR